MANADWSIFEARILISRAVASTTAMTTKFPPSKVKSAMKKHVSHRKFQLGKDSDILLWLDYLLMMQKLAAAAQDKAKEEKSTTVSAAHLQKVAKNIMKSCKG